MCSNLGEDTNVSFGDAEKEIVTRNAFFRRDAFDRKEYHSSGDKFLFAFYLYTSAVFFITTFYKYLFSLINKNNKYCYPIPF